MEHPTQRRTFTCWSCQRDYQLTLDLRDKEKLLLECPFCGKECVVDLTPFVQEGSAVFKGGDQATAEQSRTLNLPTPIPTQPPEVESP